VRADGVVEVVVVAGALLLLLLPLRARLTCEGGCFLLEREEGREEDVEPGGWGKRGPGGGVLVVEGGFEGGIFGRNDGG
jgi:hypothetical protein